MTAGFNVALPCPGPGETLTIKPVMDSEGNWTFEPYVLWHDEKGWHDRPAIVPPPQQNVVLLRRDTR